MDAKTETLVPTGQLAHENPIRMPNESAAYRAARQALLAEEFALRRQIERVAALRRALPPGGLVAGDYRFDTEDGPSDLAGLFGDKQTLVVYNYMFGPERTRPCPMCTNLLDAWDGNADDLAQRVSLVVVARSPLERLASVKRDRGWKNLRLASAVTHAFTHDYGASPDDGLDSGGPAVFTRRDGAIRHFWSQEMIASDPGQDPRGAPDLAPLWTVLDMTPEGRGADWYPSLEYPGYATGPPSSNPAHPPLRCRMAIIPIGSDHRGFALKSSFITWLNAHGFAARDLGPHSADRCDALDIAKAMADEFSANPPQFGVLICGTGQAMAMTANRYARLRAALCTNADMARLAREHNDANVLALGADITAPDEALRILAVFLNTQALGRRYAERRDRLTALGGL